MSMSNTPTSISSSWARASDKFVVKVLFPTPPFPDSMMILFLTLERASLIRGMSGSGFPQYFCNEQLLQVDAFPASLDPNPGHFSGTVSGHLTLLIFLCYFSKVVT